MNYHVVIANRARRELDGIPSSALEAFERKMLSLGEIPRPPGCKKLKGDERTWRIRSGNQIDDSAKVVTIVGVGHRKDIYR